VLEVLGDPLLSASLLVSNRPISGCAFKALRRRSSISSSLMVSGGFFGLSSPMVISLR